MELDQDGPLTKWKSKNGNRFQLQLLLFRCYWIPVTTHREARTRPLIIFMYRNPGPESYRPIDRRAAAHCFNAAWRMAAASAVRHVGLIDPESCLTNVCTCVDVWTCERVNMPLVFFIQGLG